MTREEATKKHYLSLLNALECCIQEKDFSGASEISRRLSDVSENLPEGTLSPEDIADRLGIKAGTVRQWCRDKLIECVALRGAGKEEKKTARECKKYVITHKAYKTFLEINTIRPEFLGYTKTKAGKSRKNI